MDACNTNERLAFQSKATPQFGAFFSQSHDINLVFAYHYQLQGHNGQEVDGHLEQYR